MSDQDRQWRSVRDPLDVALEPCRSMAIAIKSVIADLKAKKPAEAIVNDLVISRV